MKLYVVYAYPPDTDEDSTFFGVFESEQKYKEALNEFGDDMDFEFEEGTYTVIETELNAPAL